MQATQDLLLYAHTFFFFSNFVISWFLVRKFMSLKLLMLTDERKWAFMAFALFSLNIESAILCRGRSERVTAP